MATRKVKPETENLSSAIDSILRERKMNRNALINAIEAALISAYKKNYGRNSDVRVTFDGRDVEITAQKSVVEEVQDPHTEITLEEARECAVDCTLNILRALEQDLGSLDRVESFVKMTVFVACPPQFGQLPQVADASTALLSQLYGPQRGLPTRTTVGVTALANGFPVEIEVLVRVEAAPEL